jgi:hypothetical protein
MDPTQQLSVRLPAQSWNLVLAALGELQQSAGATLAIIRQQCLMHETPQWQPRANGGSPAGSEDATEGTSP